MLRFIFASLVAAAGLFFMNLSLPFMAGILSQFGSLGFIYSLFEGLILVVLYKVVSGQLSGPGWVRGTMFGIILFGLSSFMLAGAAGILSPSTVVEGGAQARQFAAPLGLTEMALAEGIVRVANANMERAIRVVSVQRGFDWQGAVIWVVTGAFVGSIMQDKPESTTSS